MGLGKFERYDGKIMIDRCADTCRYTYFESMNMPLKHMNMHPFTGKASSIIHICSSCNYYIYTVFNSSCLSRRCMPLAGFKRKRWSICTHFVSWLLVAWESQAWLELKAGISIKRQLGVHRGNSSFKRGHQNPKTLEDFGTWRSFWEVVNSVFSRINW